MSAPAPTAKVILHLIETDAVTKRVTLHIQLSESGPVEIRRGTWESAGERGWRLNCDDSLVEELQEIATRSGMRSSAFIGELMSRILTIHDYPNTLSFPIVMDGTWLKPTKRSWWSRFISRF